MLPLQGKLDAQIKSWLAFATEKLAEVRAVALALEDRAAAQPQLDAASAALAARACSPAVVNTLVQKRAAAVDATMAARLWVNPDCGLKTRAWPETEAALRNLVSAARVLRERFAANTRETAVAVAAGN
jgi:hypothetical protein